MYRGHRVSLVLPCYNEEVGLQQLLQDLPEVVDEVVVVDNNSRDRTADVARSYGAVVVHEERQGYGAAYKAGLRRASGDYVVAMDGDGTYPCHAIASILAMMLERKLDFVTCDRTGYPVHGANGLMRVLGNRLLSIVQTALFAIPVHDSQSGMWVLRRPILPLLTLASDDMAFSEEIKIEAFTHPDIAAAELPIGYRPRHGKSNLRLWEDGLGNLLFLFAKRLALWRTRRRRGTAAGTVEPPAGIGRPLLEGPKKE